jgi:hypothetical protein
MDMLFAATLDTVLLGVVFAIYMLPTLLVGRLLFGKFKD